MSFRSCSLLLFVTTTKMLTALTHTRPNLLSLALSNFLWAKPATTTITTPAGVVSVGRPSSRLMTPLLVFVRCFASFLGRCFVMSIKENNQISAELFARALHSAVNYSSTFACSFLSYFFSCFIIITHTSE